MRFEHSNLLVYCLVLIVFFGLGFGYLFLKINRRLYWIELGLRFVGILALIGAMLGPYFESSKETSKVVALVDISDSFDAGVGQGLLSVLAGYSSESTQLELVPFSGRVAPVSIPMEVSRSFSQVKSSWAKLDLGQTNLEEVLNSIAKQEVASVILVSDGFETEGDLKKTPISTLGPKIFPIVPENRTLTAQNFKISNLDLPLVAPAQKQVDIRVSLINTTDLEKKGRLEVKQDGKSIFSEQVVVRANSEQLFIAQSAEATEGIKEVTATLTPFDSIMPSTETAYLSGEMRQQVLLVSSNDTEEHLLKQALTNQAYRLRAVRPESVDPTKLNDFSAVIINNVPLRELAAGTDRAVNSYVKSGGGLILIGGDRSFGLGGYLSSSIAEASPLEPLSPQTEKKRLNVAVALVIDKSGSMGSEQKIEFAKDACREVITNLKEDDYIGVIGFDQAPWEVIPMTQLGTDRAELLNRVSRIYPAKTTNMLPALEEARRRLVRANAGRKHMIVLTDGRVPDAGPQYTELVKQLRLLGITVSTVMIGSEDSTLLEDMADAGGGMFYQTGNAASLPKIFIQDIKVASGEKTLQESREYPVTVSNIGPKSTSLDRYPPLRGYVQTKLRARAALELVLRSGEGTEPLLASWSFGQGRSVAFASDATGRWSSYWASWPNFQRFWSDLLESVKPKGDEIDQQVKFDLRHSLSGRSLNLDLSVFSESAARNVKAKVIRPGGVESLVSFVESTKGHFQAVLPKVEAGKYEIRLEAGQKKLTPVAFALSGELFGEKKGQGFNLENLSYMAAASGGKINPNPAEVRTNVHRERIKLDLTAYFVLLAAFLFGLEILWREVWARRFGRRRSVAQAY